MVSCASPWGLSSNRLKQSAYRGPSPLGRAAPSAFALRFDAPGHQDSHLVCAVFPTQLQQPCHMDIILSFYRRESEVQRGQCCPQGRPQPVPAQLEFKFGSPDSEACSLATRYFLRLVHEDFHSKPTVVESQSRPDPSSPLRRTEPLPSTAIKSHRQHSRKKTNKSKTCPSDEMASVYQATCSGTRILLLTQSCRGPT